MKKTFTAVALAFTLSACANSALMVETPNTSSYKTSTASISYDTSNVDVDQENIDYTQNEMQEAFFGGDKPLFSEGSGITVKYRYIGFDEGSQALRYLAGPIAGGSKVLLEVDFIDSNGTMLSQVRAEGSVSGGFFGGSNKSGIKQAVNKVADYASKEFGETPAE
jgi:hypothetical protein